MKYLLIIACFFVTSCQSKPNEDTFNTWLLIHNQKAHYNFFKDSLDQASAIEIEYIGNPDKSLLHERLKSSGDVFKDKWNEPYDISKDYNLTMEKYLDYCKANGKDPKTFYEFID
jgi:hypothetical protein